MPNVLTHTVRRQDGIHLNVHDAHLWLKIQANLSNISRTPLDYCKEVGQGITKEEADIFGMPMHSNANATRIDGLALPPIPPFLSQDILVSK
jgi:hypothetical protein